MYTEQEIVEYETKYDLKLPKKLRYYLINISDTTNDYCEYKIRLDEPYCPAGDFDYTDPDTDKSYFLQINDLGCARAEYICIKGPQYGRCGEDCDTFFGVSDYSLYNDYLFPPKKKDNSFYSVRS